MIFLRCTNCEHINLLDSEKKFQRKIIKWIKVIRSCINRLVGCFIRLLCAKNKNYSFIAIVNGVVNLLSGNHRRFIRPIHILKTWSIGQKLNQIPNTTTQLVKHFLVKHRLPNHLKGVFSHSGFGSHFRFNKFFIHFNGRHHIKIDF